MAKKDHPEPTEQEEFTQMMADWGEQLAAYEIEKKKSAVAQQFNESKKKGLSPALKNLISDWGRIYENTEQLDDDRPSALRTRALMNDERTLEEGGPSFYDDQDDNGFGKKVRGDKQATKGDITYNSNPTTFYSVGPDAAPYDGPNRVSKFSDSPEISELAKIKTQLEVLERRVHSADVKNQTDKRNKIMDSIKKLRKKIHEMSEKIQSTPDTDVT